jgi:hypothetical protein
MQAIVYQRYGSPDVFEFKEIPIPMTAVWLTFAPPQWLPFTHPPLTTFLFWKAAEPRLHHGQP